MPVLQRSMPFLQHVPQPSRPCLSASHDPSLLVRPSAAREPSRNHAHLIRHDSHPGKLDARRENVVVCGCQDRLEENLVALSKRLFQLRKGHRIDVVRVAVGDAAEGKLVTKKVEATLRANHSPHDKALPSRFLLLSTPLPHLGTSVEAAAAAPEFVAESALRNVCRFVAYSKSTCCRCTMRPTPAHKSDATGGDSAGQGTHRGLPVGPKAHLSEAHFGGANFAVARCKHHAEHAIFAVRIQLLQLCQSTMDEKACGASEDSGLAEAWAEQSGSRA